MSKEPFRKRLEASLRLSAMLSEAEIEYVMEAVSIHAGISTFIYAMAKGFPKARKGKQKDASSSVYKRGVDQGREDTLPMADGQRSRDVTMAEEAQDQTVQSGEVRNIQETEDQ